MGLIQRTDAYVVFLCTDPADIRHLKEDDPSTRLKHDAIRVAAFVPTCGCAPRRRLRDMKYLFASTFHRIREPLLSKGLKQIIHCVNFEGAQRILVMRSSKNN